MNLKDAVELTKKYGASENTIQFVLDLFGQSDSRYEYFSEAAIVAGFLNNNAILIENIEAPSGFDSIVLDENESKFVREPQKDDKVVAIKLLKSFGFEFTGSEVRFSGGAVDVLGYGKGRTIAVECGPCRIGKAVDYLEQENTELWLIPVDFWQTRKFFIVSRGTKWGYFLSFHKKCMVEEFSALQHFHTALIKF